jgi:type I restriction enzyme S subunit
MSFPRYPAYKPSGVEWLGEVPEHWQEKPLKTITSINDEVLPESLSPDYEIEYVDIGSVSLANGIEKTEAMPFGDAPARARRIPRNGDVLVSTIRTYLKAIAPVVNPPLNLVASTGFAVVRPGHELEPGFLKYALQEEHFIQQVISRSTGVSYPAINASDVAKISLNLPGTSEQLAIVTFLDHETAKIDTLIAEQQRLIELLQEKRQAVISHAVTKGLNPDAPMKDSGVEWLGEVPEHWDVKSCRNIASIGRGASPRPAGDSRYFGGDFIPWVTVAEITKECSMWLCSTEQYLTEEGAANSTVFSSGTVIYSNSGATLGVPKILKIDCCANDGVVGFRGLDLSLKPEFLYHFLWQLTDSIREWAKQGQGQPNLNTEIIKSIKIPLPPLEEQVDILRKLDEDLFVFDSLVSEADKAQFLLGERRSALISAAVTGQIDVRGLVPEVEAA